LGDPDFKHKVFTLEQEFAAHCHAKHALATSSGTSALYIPLMALGLELGDEVLVPAFIFVATYSAVILPGSFPF
jgi:dTDP-4-amino-4,6-dideoxygalactose transaminase